MEHSDETTQSKQRSRYYDIGSYSKDALSSHAHRVLVQQKNRKEAADPIDWMERSNHVNTNGSAKGNACEAPSTGPTKK